MANGNGTTKATSGRGRKPTKTLSDVQAKVIAENAIDPISKEAAKARRLKVNKETADITVEKSLGSVTAARLSVSSAFDAVVTDLQDKIQQLQSINEAIQLKTEELEALHDKDAVLSTTADLLAKHEETKKRIAEELDELQKNYAFKRAELEKVFNESRLEAEKQRKREAEDHQYNLALARKKEQDAYDEKVRLRDQADRAKEEALTKNWQLREEALAAREAEYNKQKAENETFQQRVDTQVAKDVAIVGNKMKADHNVQVNQMNMSFEAEKKVLGMEISHLKATVDTQQKAIDSLNAQLKESREQQNALALKAMEVDSGKAALDAVKDFAANSSPSKK